MDPTTVAIIASALVKYGPAVARGIAEIFNKDAPTLEDWNKVFALAERSYESYTAPTQSV